MIPTTKPATLFSGPGGAAIERRAHSTYQSVPSKSGYCPCPWPYHKYSSIVNVTSLFVVFPYTLPSPDSESFFPTPLRGLLGTAAFFFFL